MKITRTGSVTSTPNRRVGKRTGHDSESFGSHVVPEEASAPPAMSGVKNVGALDAVLVAQEVDDPASRPAKARQRGEDILDKLDKLRHGLLTGALSRRDLESLTRLVRLQRIEINDPKLAEILDQIELRAEIELAKYSTLD